MSTSNVFIVVVVFEIRVNILTAYFEVYLRRVTFASCYASVMYLTRNARRLKYHAEARVFVNLRLTLKWLETFIKRHSIHVQNRWWTIVSRIKLLRYPFSFRASFHFICANEMNVMFKRWKFKCKHLTDREIKTRHAIPTRNEGKFYYFSLFANKRSLRFLFLFLYM